MGGQGGSGVGFREIAQELREAIRSKSLPPGSPLPSETDVVKRWGVARVTARRALAALEAENLIETVPGRGRFVRDAGGTSGERTGAKFEAVAAAVRRSVESGAFPPGSRVPSESELSEQFQASVGTVRQALRVLESRGLLVSLPGKGRYVPHDPESGPAVMTDAERIAADIRRDIARGELAAGATLAGENDLAARYGVARGTVRRALTELERAGLVDIARGRGRFVVEQPASRADTESEDA
ncbi:GntR family transcriptional regulator [Plantactinospora sp. S1510]|uniref:GntR family transcriptional regulator n=1 Tax=Plantactinospora alkalitolerans TaxID=2789879 RepID=A0ABS0H3D7_9ACTN|nr:GntR family transcriptional regulator [Plantactinospora alkalitolerans]MBF9132627.1 GntR family transcriptional regulator [Plantactinospora alkalitolerans]